MEDLTDFVKVLGGVIVGVLGALGGLKWFQSYWGHRRKTSEQTRAERKDDQQYLHDGYRELLEIERGEAKADRDRARKAIEEVDRLKNERLQIVIENMQKAAEIERLKAQIEGFNVNKTQGSPD